MDLEIPIGKRSKLYRAFEMLPAIISYGAIILLVVLSIFNPLLAAAYLLTIIITTLVKAVGIAYHTTLGRANLDKAQKINWRARLDELEDPKASLDSPGLSQNDFGYKNHINNLSDIINNTNAYPKPSELYNAVIIATYNESYNVLHPTIESPREAAWNR
jgi:hypothetical protein